MLEIVEVSAGYGEFEVLHQVTIAVEPAEIVTVIGANGAGKSTLLKTVSGLLKPTSGRIVVDGVEHAGNEPAALVAAGVVLVPEGRQVFSDQTVADNLLLGAYAHRRRLSRAALRERTDEVLSIFPELQSRQQQFAGALSGGQQQSLAIARGLMASPRYLLLDEPSLGLAPQVVERIFRVIADLRLRGVGILLVEQNGQLALRLSQRCYVFEEGKVAMSGESSALRTDPEVLNRYLGIRARNGEHQTDSRLVEGLQAAMRN